MSFRAPPLAGPFVGLLLLGILTGCGVPPAGFVGITVGPDGEPQAVLAVCKGYIDEINIYEGVGEKSVIRQSWKHTPRVKDVSLLTLASPSNGWAVDGTSSQLSPTHKYTIYGSTSDNRWSALPLDFSPSAFASLRSGQVRYAPTPSGAVAPSFSSPSAFRDAACRGFGDSGTN